MFMTRSGIGRIILNICLTAMSLVFIIPLLWIISASLSKEADLMSYGYSIIPRVIDLTAYKAVFSNPNQIMDAYWITFFISVTGTILSLLVMSAVAYPMSRDNCIFKNQLTFYVVFTMLFSGGLIPSYILITQYLKLQNNILVYILPSLANGFNIIIFRTFFKGLPAALVESAKIDGANEYRIFAGIILPLSKPVLATIGLMVMLAKWNDWYTCLLYIRDKKLYTLQYLLQKILMDADFLFQMTKKSSIMSNANVIERPTESMRFAMAVLAAGPMMVVFPFFQKYFAKGLTIGAVKG